MRAVSVTAGVLPAWVFLLLPVLLMQACSVFTMINPDPATVPGQQRNIMESSNDLAGLEQIDTVVKLNNHWLSSQISNTLLSEADKSEKIHFDRLKVNFSNQFISIDADIDVSDDDGNVISTSVKGDIHLSVNHPQLVWTASFDQLLINDRDFSFEDGQYAEPVPELISEILGRLNEELLQHLQSNGRNSIMLNMLPMGEIGVGAVLSDLSASAASHNEPLRGFFITAGSANLIETDYTSFALDLVYIPGISTCSTDITVSRSDFASEIEAREPVKTGNATIRADDIKYFFTEISGAKRDLTIIHFWYANGRAVAVEELAVGVSKRWRTWSSGGTGYAAGDHLQVLVVEKESGCILLSKDIQLEAIEAPASTEPVPLKQSFKQLQDNFNLRTRDLSVDKHKPAVAVINTRRSFLKKAIEGALSDLTIQATFDPASMSTLNKEAWLQAFNLADINCETRDCPPAKVCKTNISHCKRFRDTRNCTSCLFRNPLNNRCVSESTDPVCEASRDRQNARFEAERNACIADAETSKQECDYLNIQASRSCEIEAGFADNACDSIKSSIRNLEPGTALAYINSSAKPIGSLAVNFSNFRIEGDFEKLKLDMSLTPNLQIVGDLNFRPASIARPLATCIAGWSAPFKSRVTNTPALSNLQSSMEQQRNTLVARWSGFGLTIDTRPSPFESVLVGHPQLLANCKIGLTVDKVERAVAGDDSGYYRGQFELEVQPLPTRIYLSPASIQQADTVLRASAQLSAKQVSYFFEK